MLFFTEIRQLCGQIGFSVTHLIYCAVYFFLISSVFVNWMINVIFQNPTKLIKVFHLIISDQNPKDLYSLKLVSFIIGSSLSTMHMYFCLIFSTILLNYKYRKVISKCKKVLTYVLTMIALLYSIVIFIRTANAPNPQNAVSSYFSKNICTQIAPNELKSFLSQFTEQNGCLVSYTEVGNDTLSIGPPGTPQCFPDGAVRKYVLMYRVMEYTISAIILLLFSVIIYMHASVIWKEYKMGPKTNKVHVIPKRRGSFSGQNSGYADKEELNHYVQFNKIQLPKKQMAEKSVNEDRNSRRIDLKNGYSSANSEYENVMQNGNYNRYEKSRTIISSLAKENEYESDLNHDYVSMKEKYNNGSVDHPLDNGMYEEIKLGKFDLHKNAEGSEQSLSIRDQNRQLYDNVDNGKYYYRDNNNDSSATDTDMTDNDAKSVKNKMNLVQIYDETTTNSETEVESHDEYFRRGHSMYYYPATDTETETDNITVISGINRYQKRNF